jgi:L-asparaginase
MSSELVHISLGGTISMRVVNGLAVPALNGAQLAALAGIATTPVDLAALGGPQLDFGLLVATAQAIRAAEARGVGAVIVTLGTDAIEEVGAFLAYTGPWHANVVITGAMSAGGEPDSDGPQNLRDAAAVAAGPHLAEPVVVFAGRVTLARATVKVSGLELDAFASETQMSWSVEEVRRSGSLPGLRPTPTPLGAPGEATVEVPIIVSALSIGPVPGSQAADPAATRAARAPALVCVGTGAGNLNREVTDIAEAALAAGSTVAIATRALDRRMSAGYGYPGGSGQLVGAGAVLATGMSPYRARMFLLVALSQGLRGVHLSSRLSSHVDEMSVTF